MFTCFIQSDNQGRDVRLRVRKDDNETGAFYDEKKIVLILRRLRASRIRQILLPEAIDISLC